VWPAHGLIPLNTIALPLSQSHSLRPSFLELFA
jgi:hypothetical protein